MKKNSRTSDPKWELADILDLEYFIHSDRDAVEESLDQRDRMLYRDHIEPVLKDARMPERKINSTILRLWLEHRRKHEAPLRGKSRILPGDVFDDAFRLLRFFLLLAGIIAGCAITLTVLRYTGHKPVNISYYAGALVAVQILFLAALFFFSALRRTGTLKAPASPMYKFIAHILAGLAEKMGKGLKSKTASSHQKTGDGFLAALGLVRGRKKVWGRVMYWPLFCLAQLFGVGLNLGILTTTLVRVALTDLAFGWQSTLDIGAQFVYRLTGYIAVPWIWLVPSGTARPTLAQIEGSRMILKDGIYQLTTQDLTAWWPFLCLCVLFYGLLPRVFLFFFGILMQKRSLSKLDFTMADCDRILTRLATPLVSTRGSDQPEADLLISPEDSLPESEDVLGSMLKHDTRCIALIPEDIFEQSPTEELLKRFPNRFSIKGIDRYKISIDTEADEAILHQLSEKQKNGDLSNIFLLLEAWQPPIKETLSYITALRNMLDDHFLIYIGLIGKPDTSTIFTPVKDADYLLWQQKISRLADPFIRVERYTS